jgi:predicted nucleic acid-binding protein
MTSSIDSNIIVGLWRKTHASNLVAARLLHQARMRGKLVVSGPVYSELMGDPDRTEEKLDRFVSGTGISVDWTLDEDVWREAGKAYLGYFLRRKAHGATPPRRILADFLIGAHAVVHGYSLLTFDGDHYKAAFPTLTIISE